MNNHSKKGFTLIELLVVIAIIGILSTIGLVALNGARGKARDTQRISDMRQYGLAYQAAYDSGVKYVLTGCTQFSKPSACTALADFFGSTSTKPEDPSNPAAGAVITAAATCTVLDDQDCETVTGLTAVTAAVNYAITRACDTTTATCTSTGFALGTWLEAGAGGRSKGFNFMTENGWLP